MTEIAVLFAAGAATALATGLGAIPVFMLGQRAAGLRPVLLGLAIGVMGVVSVQGLLLPAFDEGAPVEVLLGVALGVGFLLAGRSFVHRREPVVMGVSGRGAGTVVLVFGVLTVHSLPEGLAIGTAYASDTAGLSLFVIVAIAIHNIPEGTSVAVPMEAAGFSAKRQFWAAVLTSAPQPPGAVLSYLAVEQVQALLPASFGFAAGAMLALIAWELLPHALAERRWVAALGTATLGGATMVGLGLVLGLGT